MKKRVKRTPSTLGEGRDGGLRVIRFDVPEFLN
jgi:hypothetical protein